MKWVMVSLALLLSACSLQPKMQSATHAVQVEIAPSTFVNLPQPIELNENINVSQLITAQWGTESKHKLLVQLQVDQQKVVLAGFSAWGVKLLSLRYFGIVTDNFADNDTNKHVDNHAGNHIETNVMAGLEQSLPQPERILFNVMLSIWPKSAWDEPLSQIGWTLQDNKLQRLLIDKNGEVVVTINYEMTPYLDGKITFQHHRLNYNVTIETN